MKAVLFFLIMGLIPSVGFACRNDTSTCTAAPSAGKGCKSPGVTPKTCYIRGNSTCYKINNSTGKDIFIPTNTGTEFTNFITFPPTGVTATVSTYGTTCFPTCYYGGTCGTNAVPTWGSATNPP